MLGVIQLILGWVLNIRIFSTTGIVVLIIGVVFVVLAQWVTLWVDANWY